MPDEHDGDGSVVSESVFIRVHPWFNSLPSTVGTEIQFEHGDGKTIRSQLRGTFNKLGAEWKP